MHSLNEFKPEFENQIAKDIIIPFSSLISSSSHFAFLSGYFACCRCSDPFTIIRILKGLSYEIDFENVDEN
jgi:hypothetical protein